MEANQQAALAAEYETYVKREVRAGRAPLDPNGWMEAREDQRRGTEREFRAATPSSEPERAARPIPSFALLMLQNGERDSLTLLERARHFVALGPEPDAFAGGDGKLPPDCPLCGGPLCPWAGVAVGGAT